MKNCSLCKIDKDEVEFPKIGKQCKSCLSEKARSRYQAKTGGAGRKKRANVTPPPRAADSLYQRPSGLGFKVQLEVDTDTGVTDVRLDQYNSAVSAEQSIWLSQLEAAELRAWLSDHLGPGS